MMKILMSDFFGFLNTAFQAPLVCICPGKDFPHKTIEKAASAIPLLRKISDFSPWRIIIFLCLRDRRHAYFLF
jgi:hypothetical protein